MATTLRQLSGFETEDLLEASSTSGAPAVNTTAPVRSGTASLKLDAAATLALYGLYSRHSTFGIGADVTSDHFIIGGAWYFTNLAPSAVITFMRLWDGIGGANTASLNLNTDGNLLIRDANDSLVTNGSIASPFTVNTWHYIELYVNAVASGAWEVWIDGNSAGSGSGQDFLVSGSTVIQNIYFQGGTTGDGNVRVDDIYLISDDSVKPTPFGPSNVFAYQGAKTAVEADTGLTTSDTSLPAGTTWDDAAEAPVNTANFAQYTGTADGAVIFNDAAILGHGPGPNGGAYTIDGTIRGAKWWQQTSRGNGGSSTHHMWYGNGTDVSITRSSDLSLGTTGSQRAFISVSAAEVPLATQYFAMGMETTGTKDYNTLEQFAFLLHTPSSVVNTDLGRPMGMRGQNQMSQLLST